MKSLASFKETNQKIINYISSGSLKDLTLKNLMNNPHIKVDDNFYSGLNWLAAENKIVFLITPVETYVLPVN